jgi:hypothetical protein
VCSRDGVSSNKSRLPAEGSEQPTDLSLVASMQALRSDIISLRADITRIQSDQTTLLYENGELKEKLENVEALLLAMQPKEKEAADDMDLDN